MIEILPPGTEIMSLYRGPLDQDVNEFMQQLDDATGLACEFRIKANEDAASIYLEGWRIDFYPGELRGLDRIRELAVCVSEAISNGKSGWKSEMPKMRLWREPK